MSVVSCTCTYCYVPTPTLPLPTLFVSSGLILLSFPYSTSLTWFTIFQSIGETENLLVSTLANTWLTCGTMNKKFFMIILLNFITWQLYEDQWTSTGQPAVPYLMFNEISIKKDSIYNAKTNKILFIIFCIASLLVKWGLKTSIINKLKCLKLVKYCIVLNVSFMWF